MKNPTPAARRALRRDLRRLKKVNERLRRHEGALSFHVEQRGPFARQAGSLAAALQCILSDQLVPAADALEREIDHPSPLLEDDDPGEPEDGPR